MWPELTIRNKSVMLLRVVEGLMQALLLCVRHGRIRIAVDAQDRRKAGPHVGHRRDLLRDRVAVQHRVEPRHGKRSHVQTGEQFVDVSDAVPIDDGRDLQLVGVLRARAAVARTDVLHSCRSRQYTGRERQMTAGRVAGCHDLGLAEIVLFGVPIRPSQGTTGVLDRRRRKRPLTNRYSMLTTVHPSWR